jgi:hypothetical protein
MLPTIAAAPATRQPAAPASRQRSATYKTELCARWVSGQCTYCADCTYAHGAHELLPRQRPSSYKTALCKSFIETGGHCPYGPRCNFLHAFTLPERPAGRAAAPAVADPDRSLQHAAALAAKALAAAGACVPQQPDPSAPVLCVSASVAMAPSSEALTAHASMSADAAAAMLGSWWRGNARALHVRRLHEMAAEQRRAVAPAPAPVAPPAPVMQTMCHPAIQAPPPMMPPPMMSPHRQHWASALLGGGASSSSSSSAVVVAASAMGMAAPIAAVPAAALASAAAERAAAERAAAERAAAAAAVAAAARKVPSSWGPGQLMQIDGTATTLSSCAVGDGSALHAYAPAFCAYTPPTSPVAFPATAVHGLPPPSPMATGGFSSTRSSSTGSSTHPLAHEEAEADKENTEGAEGVRRVFDFLEI